jgi:RNA polymerase sigma factor for flagellar operon FliA
MGLIDAVDRYDYTRGVKFETYAVSRIRGYLVDQMRAADWLPRSARANVRLVYNASSQLEESLGRKPVLSEVSTRTGLPDAACAQALVDGACRVLSLEEMTPEADDASSPMVRQLEDEGAPNPADAVERRELRRGVARALNALPPRERAAVRLKYVSDWTCRQIAAHLGVSESRVSQLHNQGLARMRRALTADFGELSDNLSIA